MADCLHICNLRGGHKSSPDDVDEPDEWENPATAPQRISRNELDPYYRLFPMQRPRDLPIHAWAVSPTGSSLFVSPILKEPTIHIHLLYFLSSKIGSGRFSVTYRCTNCRTGRVFACKRIKRDQPEMTVKRLKNEIKMLHYLSGLPHIIKFDRAYEGHDYVYLIMELCNGGELSQRIRDGGRLPESQALCVFRQIITAVHYCHLMGVMHRDIRPENVILLDNSEDLSVRVIDFGTSRFFEEGKKYRYRSRNVDYAAPEVLDEAYGKEADVWSAGVILYLLLSGEHPFPTSDEFGLLLRKAIKQGKFDMQREPWPSITEQAKDLITKMLNTDPKRRITTGQILEHPWAKQSNVLSPIRLPRVFEFFSRLRRIREMNVIRRLILLMMVDFLPKERISHFQRGFTRGTIGDWNLISFEGFCDKAFAVGFRLTDDEFTKLIEQDICDVYGASEPFMELLLTMVPTDWWEDDRVLGLVFEKLRQPGTWYIDKKRIEVFLKTYFRRGPSEEVVDAGLREVGICPDWTINKTMFFNIMQEGGEQHPWVKWMSNLVQHCKSRLTLYAENVKRN